MNLKGLFRGGVYFLLLLLINHLTRFVEATASQEDVVFVLVATPVLVGSGASPPQFARRRLQHRLSW